MDATIQLATTEKLREVFKEDDTYVIRPLVPDIFSTSQLEVIGRGSATAAELGIESEWNRAVNVIPSGRPFVGAERRYLWEFLRDLKSEEVVLALPEVSDEAESEATAAAELLFVAPAAETKEFSPTYLTYLQCWDLYQSALLLYRQREGEALSSGDAAVVSFWENTAKVSYQSGVDQAMFKWQHVGRKADIENAQRVLAAAAAREPETQWTQWLSRFSVDIDTHSDMSLLQFVPTSFSPTNFSEQLDWPEVRIDAQELALLHSSASDELRQHYGPMDGDIRGLSFEFCRVNVERAWFPRKIVDARFWKFGGPGKLLSDGGTPPSGELPGYIVAALLVRNLSVSRLKRTEPVSPPKPPTDFRLGDAIRWRVFQRLPVTPVDSRPSVELKVHRAGVLRSPAAAVRVGDLAGAHVPAAAVAIPADELHLVRASIPSRSRRDVAAFDKLTSVDRDLQQKMREISILSKPPMDNTTLESQVVLGKDDICVLAYLWRGCPRSPDPDNSLQWPV